MRKSKVLPLLFLFMATSVLAQDQFFNKLEGRVYSGDGDVAATHVLNITSNRFTITDTDGFFEIPARLYDTLVFSAVQFKRKEIVVTLDILEQDLLMVPMEDALTQLSEVVVRPYNLSGDISRDVVNLKTEAVTTASTLKLPNAYVKIPTQAERKLYEATSGSGLIPLNPILNGISGRTKMLKKRVKRDEKYARTQRVRAFYTDSLFTTEFKIPQDKIDDFMFFCEVDMTFQEVVDTHDRLKIWEYLRRKSLVYRNNNELD
ncbi:MAG: hypothetical protein ACR2MT_01505 [Aurantibacter sp.]